MVCKFCGTENKDSERFCGKCGAALSAEKPPQQFQQQPPARPNFQNPGSDQPLPSKPALPLNKIIMAAGAVILLIIAISVIPGLFKGGVYELQKNPLDFFQTEEGALVLSKNGAQVTVDGDVYSQAFSMTRSDIALLMDYDSSDGGTLWYVSGTSKTEVADEVVYYAISDDGGAIAYLSELDDDCAVLTIYDCGSKKKTTVTDEAYYSRYADTLPLCISPDGKSVGYISDYDEDDGTYYAYVKINSKSPEKLSKNTACIAIANGGKYIYYEKSSDGETSVYVKKDKDDTKIIPSASSYGTLILLNKDYSQAIFPYEERMYITRNGGEREKISNTVVIPVMADKTAVSSTQKVSAIAIKSFLDAPAWTSGSGIYVIDKKLESNKLTSSYGNPYLADNYKTAIFLDSSDNLCYIDVTKKDAEKKELAEDVNTFRASADGKTIYFINEDDELHVIKNFGKPKKVADDVSSGTIVIPHGTSRAFFLLDFTSSSGGELNYSENNAKKKSVSGADETRAIFASANGMYYIGEYSSSSGTYELYRSNGNDKFSLVSDDVTYYYNATSSSLY